MANENVMELEQRTKIIAEAIEALLREKIGIFKLLDENLVPDCIIKMKNDNIPYFLNLKTSLTVTKSSGRFDISKARKLIFLTFLVGKNKKF